MLVGPSHTPGELAQGAWDRCWSRIHGGGLTAVVKVAGYSGGGVHPCVAFDVDDTGLTGGYASAHAHSCTYTCGREHSHRGMIVSSLCAYCRQFPGCTLWKGRVEEAIFGSMLLNRAEFARPRDRQLAFAACTSLTDREVSKRVHPADPRPQVPTNWQPPTHNPPYLASRSTVPPPNLPCPTNTLCSSLRHGNPGPCFSLSRSPRLPACWTRWKSLRRCQFG